MIGVYKYGNTVDDKFVIYKGEEVAINWYMCDSGLLIFRDNCNKITICKQSEAKMLITIRVVYKTKKIYLGDD